MEKREGLPRRSRVAALSGLLALFVPLVAVPGRADVVWRVADEGPRAPGSGNGSIFGNDSRVFWYGADGTRELDGSVWRRVELDASASPEGRLAPFIAAGERFVAATFREGGIQLFALEGNVWKPLASVGGVGPARAHTADRLYVTSAACFPDLTECMPGFVCTPDAAARRLRSISLSDGSVREEPPLPACFGQLFVLSGKLHLLQEGYGCTGQSTGNGAPVSIPAVPNPYPSFRLDTGVLLEIPDAGAWLAANGVPIDPSAFAGTLTFRSDRPDGAGALLVTAVVQARGAGAAGDYGVSVPVVNEVRWATDSAIVPGPREDAG